MNMDSLESRAFALETTEIREQNGRSTFRGYASVYNSLSENLGGFREQVIPGAFTRTLRENPDVAFLINHDANKVLGRTTSGTLQLRDDSRGLAVEAELPDTSYARDLAVSMGRRDVNQMSFRFKVKVDEWETKDGVQIRSLKDVDLIEVSAVTFPAYPATTASLEERQLESALRTIGELREGKVISAKNKEFIRNLIAQLEEFLGEPIQPRSTDPRRLKLALRERQLRV